MLSVMGVMIIFALSYNMLLGQTGLLSFGHAVYYGLGGFVAIHAMNAVIHDKLGVPVAVIPIVGGVAGLGFGVLFGLVSTRRAGLVFSMISLGIGELVSSSSFILRTFFGGEEGITTNRAKLAPLIGLKFGPQIQVYWLIAIWCFVCIAAMYALTRTPFGRICNAVRDNPERVQYIGYSARRIRLMAFSFAAFFAGIAGGLAAINFEIMNAAAARRAAVGRRALDGLYRRRRLFRRPDSRRDHRHLPADQSVRPDDRLAALFRPSVHWRRVVRSRRRRRVADAPLGGGAVRRTPSSGARLHDCRAGPGGRPARRGDADRTRQPPAGDNGRRGFDHEAVRLRRSTASSITSWAAALVLLAGGAAATWLLWPKVDDAWDSVNKGLRARGRE